MATSTSHLNLVKPDGTEGGDFVDVDVINSNMDLIDAAIEDIQTTDTGWKTTVTFGSGWNASSGFLRYKIDAARNLHIQGKLTGIGSSGSSAFTLPVGFRPALPEFLKLIGAQAATAGNVRINIGSDGVVSVFYDGSPTYISINIVIAID